jgi:4-amino-4-deoxy-L-arabinose transferase-like glycosyltransferase
MNPSAVVDTEPESAQEVAPGKPEGGAIDRYSSVENWLHDHLNGVVLAVIAAGFVVRVSVASRSYLNPDEAIHYMLLNQSSLSLAYKASLTNAHPPLIYLVVYFWRLMGRSEWMLRLPSVLAGTAFCWFFFKWIGIVFGKAASAIGLVMAAFSPALIALSAQLREYALLLFGIAAALYFLERAFQEKTVREMSYFSGFLYLTILSHYSAVFLTLAIGLYSVARIADSHLPRKVIVAWAGGQMGAIAIYAFLYFTHISKIKNSIAVWGMPFDGSYFHLDRESIFSFTSGNTSRIFLYMFEQRYVSQAILLFFVVGVAYLIVRDLVSRRGNTPSSHSGILLLLPFITVWGAAIAGIYPYVGTRHTVFLAPFAIAAASFLLAVVCRQKLWAALLIAALFMGASNAYGKALEPYIGKENQSRTLIIAAMNEIRQSVPRGDLVLVDFQSSFAIAYYLCGPGEIVEITRLRGEFSEFSCGGHSIVFPSYHVWKLTAGNFPSQFEKMAHTYGLKPGDRVWVFQYGWGANLDTELPLHLPRFRCIAPKTFGDDLTVIPFVVAPDFAPATPAANCAPPPFNSVIM